jgi:hypothetical protein
MTTTTTTTPRSAARRLLSISAVATIAAVGLVALSAPAHAAPVSSKVWVCKYVGTPGVDETLKEGKNPIEVSSNSVDPGDNGQIDVGDQFADAQGRSVVVQIGGDEPDVGICPLPEDLPPPPKPGDGAPDTGGEGGDVPVGLVGGGALLVGAALVVAEAERRRRAAIRR